MSKSFVMRVQHRLNEYGAGLAEDGLAGPSTNAALDTYLPAKAANDDGPPFDPAAFFNGVRGAFGPLSQGQVDGFTAVLAGLKGWNRTWVAYALATAWHETAKTMQPIKELGGPAYFTRMYDINGDRPAKARELGNLAPGDGARYAGRGYVQLTGKINYARYGIADRPDDAMKPDVAAKILRDGMEAGRFTGKKLGDYLPGDYVNARRIINGLDKADDIARNAVGFERALTMGGWK